MAGRLFEPFFLLVSKTLEKSWGLHLEAVSQKGTKTLALDPAFLTWHHWVPLLQIILDTWLEIQMFLLSFRCHFFGAVFETQSFSPAEASKILRWKVAPKELAKRSCAIPWNTIELHDRDLVERFVVGGVSKESTSPKKTGYFEIQDLGHQKHFEVSICLAIFETLQNIDKYFPYYHILIHWTQVGMNLPRNQRRYFKKGPSYYQPKEYIIQSDILQIYHTFASTPTWKGN